MELYQIHLSKSRMMTYDYCQYKYKRIYRDGYIQEDTEKTLKGKVYHAVRDRCIEKIEMNKITKDITENYNYIRSLLPKLDSPVLDSVAKMEAERATTTSHNIYKPVIVEQDYQTLFCDPVYSKEYPEYKIADIKNILNEEQITSLNLEYDVQPIVLLKGRPDNIYMLEDGTYSVYEFKTGAWNSNTSSKIRKELIFYVKMLEPHLDAEINHISYGYTSTSKMTIEPIRSRSVNAFKSLLYKMIVSHITGEYSQKFYYKACRNCSLCEECELISRTGYV